MILLIDNYDSFTYNLFHLVGSLGARLVVRRNDAITVEQAMAMAPQGIILSPGPCDPDRAGICLPLVQAAAGRVPLLGVCLGHQSIGQAFGGRIIRAPKPMHGKLSRISHGGEGLFRGLPSPFTATRYHSLIVERSSLPAELAVTAESEDGLIMGLAHRQHALFGVQFHPESIASEQGAALLGNFLSVAESFRPQLRASA
jgi:anthranilate synthase component 2